MKVRLLLHNKDLTKDYLKRCEARLKAIQVLMNEQSYADVVRESQECIELALKALLRSVGVIPPRTHDVSKLLLDEKDRFQGSLKKNVDKFAKISKDLRRDRELAFYGSEDLTPSDFYSKEDATQAFDSATWILTEIQKQKIV